MAFKDVFLPEFEIEMAKTRKTLERVPEDKFGWKPHEKSTSMGKLASHVANIPGFSVYIFSGDSLDLAPPGGSRREAFSAKNRKELLEAFDKNVAAARTTIAGAPEAQFEPTWSLLSGGNVIFAMPRTGVLRHFMMNHLIHHRAQLGVYLRLNNVPVPSIYGPSADEQA